MLTPKEQIRIILKGVHQCVNEEELLQKLEKSYKQNKPLTIKLGLDPSASDIHLGHAVVLRKLKLLYDAAFSKKAIPDNIPVMLIDYDKDTLNDAIPKLIEMSFINSRREFIRLIKQGGVQINGEKINEDDLNQVLINSDVIKIGKKKFIKIEK